MRKIFSALIGLALWLFPSIAGAQAITRTPDCIFTIAPISAVGTSGLYDNRGAGCTDWTLTYSTFGWVSSSVQIVDAPNNSSSPGTPVAFQGTVLGGVTQPVSAGSSGTINVTGYYPYMGVSVTAKSGTGSVQGTLYGWRHSTVSGTPGVVVISGASSGSTVYATGFNSGLTVISSGSTTTITSTTTAVQSIWCNNETAGAVNLYLTDGNNAYYAGPTYQFPASTNGAVLNIPTGVIFSSGIKVSAGTASAMKCIFQGKQ